MLASDLKRMLSKNKIKEVLELLTSNNEISASDYSFNKISNLSGRYYGLREAKDDNTLSFEQYALSESQIRTSLLDYIDSLPKDIKFVKSPKNGKYQQVEMVLDKNEFEFNDKNKFLNTLSQFLGVESKEVTIIQIRSGSIILKILLPHKAAFKLITNFRKGANDKFYKDLKIISIRLKFPNLISWTIYTFYYLNRFFVSNKYTFLVITTLLAIFIIIYYPIWKKQNSEVLASLMVTKSDEVIKQLLVIDQLLQKSVDTSIETSDDIEKKTVGLEDSTAYNRVLSQLEELDRNAKLINKEQIKLNNIVREYTNIVSNIFDLGRRNPTKLKLIQKGEIEYQNLKNKLKLLNEGIDKLQKNTLLLVELIKLLKDIEKISLLKKEKIIFAANAAYKSTNMISGIEETLLQ